MMPRLFIFNKVYSMSQPGSRHRGVIVRDGRVASLLDGGECLTASSSGRFEVVDLSHACCLPGFIDSHVHLMQTGYNSLSIRLFECDSVAGVLERLEHAVSNEPENRDHVLTGHGFDESVFREGRMPTRRDLDGVSSKLPVFISRVDHHSSVANSAFIKKYRDFLVSSGATAEMLETGILRGKANYGAKGEIIRTLPEETRKNAFLAAEKTALSEGVTTLCALEGGAISGSADVDFVDGIIRGGRSNLDLVLFRQDTDIAAARAMGLPRIGGCLLIDGSFGSATAALKAPYKGGRNGSGQFFFEKNELMSFMKRAHSEGLQMAFHAIGDAAIERVLDCYEKLLEGDRGGAKNVMRHRIEHFELASARDIKRAAELGIVLSMQPVFETLWGGRGNMYEKRLGRARASRTNRFASIISAGAVVAGGSDSDVTPISPLNGIRALLSLPNEKERTGAWEAVSMFTRNGAYANFLERDRGTLAPGMAADMVALDRDPFGPGLSAAKVAATITRGRIAYEKTLKGGRK